jgi:hypothetical protein
VQALVSVQACEVAGLTTPTQSMSATIMPSLARQQLRVRVWVPSPHKLEHAPQAPIHWNGQVLLSVHACNAAGLGCGQSTSATVTPSLRWQVRVRFWTPLPQVLEHASHAPTHW